MRRTIASVELVARSTLFDVVNALFRTARSRPAAKRASGEHPTGFFAPERMVRGPLRGSTAEQDGRLCGPIRFVAEPQGRIGRLMRSRPCGNFRGGGSVAHWHTLSCTCSGWQERVGCGRRRPGGTRVVPARTDARIPQFRGSRGCARGSEGISPAAERMGVSASQRRPGHGHSRGPSGGPPPVASP